MAEDGKEVGLSGLPRDQWPRATSSALPIDILKPKSKQHEKLLKHLLTRIEFSEQEMQNFHPRWEVAEKKMQLYVDHPTWEKRLKQLNDSGEPAHPIRLTVPYSYATISTVVTYLLQAFVGRRPMFQVGTHKAETARSAQMMQLALQYHADHAKYIAGLQRFLWDGETYGVTAAYCPWNEVTKMRSVWRPAGLAGMLQGQTRERTREERVVYEGNGFENIDPYMLFPDPSVPMAECNRNGEFLAWRKFIGLHALKKEEAAGIVQYIDSIGHLPKPKLHGGTGARGMMSGGRAHAGADISGAIGAFNKNVHQLDLISIELIPHEHGIGTENLPAKWLFGIANKRQIIFAEPQDTDHDMHPVVIAEPYSLGYGFGHQSAADLMNPVQDYMSWLLNSHMDNVRIGLNNMFVVDPNAVEMQDFKKPGPGKILRLKAASRGRDIRTVLQQLQVVDLTRNHLGDMENVQRLGDLMIGANDRLRGMPEQGSRRSATEARVDTQSAASRLANHAQFISSQAITDQTEIWSMNTQQYMSEEFYFQLTGKNGLENSLWPMSLDPTQQGGVNVSPEMVVGDFHYPVHDGTVPFDRQNILDIWKEIWLAVAQSPELSQTYDAVGIFRYIAELSDAHNLQDFARGDGTTQQGLPPVEAQVVPDGAAGAGPNQVPIQALAG